MVYVLIGLGIAFVGFMYWIIMSPELKYHSFWYKLKCKIIFFFGDLRAFRGVPLFTSEIKEHFLIDVKDARKAAKLCKPGDVGLHTIKLSFGNNAIPGAFKHAWIVVDDDDCVEAISDGVIRRDLLYPLLTDYAIILRPRAVSKDDIKMAIRRANAIVGCNYDANFRFDLDEANEDITVRDQDHYTRNISGGKFHHAFSCTETVGFAWLHCRSVLRLFRSNHAGRDAIIADDYLKMNFDVVWVSPSVTEEWLAKKQMHEEGRSKIKAWLRDK